MPWLAAASGLQGTISMADTGRTAASELLEKAPELPRVSWGKGWS